MTDPTLTPADAKRLVDEHGSQTRAAEVAGVTRSMIQRRLKAYEQEMQREQEPAIDWERIDAAEIKAQAAEDFLDLLIEEHRRVGKLSRRRHQIGRGQRSLITLHKRIERDFKRGQARAAAGRYNWNP